MDPEISRQIEKFDSILTRNEKVILKSVFQGVEDQKEIEQSVVKIRSQTNSCISFNQNSAAKIDRETEVLRGVSQRENRDVTQKRNSLKRLKEKHDAQLASCRLLILRSNQLIEALQNKQRSLIATQLLSRNKTLLDNIKANIDRPGEGFDSLIDFMVSTSGLHVVYENRYLLSLFIVLSVGGTILFRKFARKFLDSQKNKTQCSFARMWLISLLCCTSRYILALLLTSSFAVYFLHFGLSLDQFPFIALVAIGLFLYVLLTLILRMIFNPVNPARPLVNLQPDVAQTLANRLRLLANLLFVGFLIFSASNLHDFSDSVTASLRNVYITLVLSLLVFAVLMSLVGWIKRRLQKSWLSRSRMDRGSKESMVALTGYTGVGIALIVSLSAAGLELANLLLIAGALSVGIGFGLQNVVNNFVSGIVLLFERPIKTGDWIIVGASQGYVKKIKLRSTVIQTFDRADVIVPNAEIIASQVTN